MLQNVFEDCTGMKYIFEARPATPEGLDFWNSHEDIYLLKRSEVEFILHDMHTISTIFF